jgi:hypothetical protein
MLEIGSWHGVSSGSVVLSVGDTSPMLEFGYFGCMDVSARGGKGVLLYFEIARGP